jgi:hypothetical protein
VVSVVVSVLAETIQRVLAAVSIAAGSFLVIVAVVSIMAVIKKAVSVDLFFAACFHLDMFLITVQMLCS